MPPFIADVVHFFCFWLISFCIGFKFLWFVLGIIQSLSGILSGFLWYREKKPTSKPYTKWWNKHREVVKRIVFITFYSSLLLGTFVIGPYTQFLNKGGSAPSQNEVLKTETLDLAKLFYRWDEESTKARNAKDEIKLNELADRYERIFNERVHWVAQFFGIQIIRTSDLTIRPKK